DRVVTLAAGGCLGIAGIRDAGASGDATRAPPGVPQAGRASGWFAVEVGEPLADVAVDVPQPEGVRPGGHTGRGAVDRPGHATAVWPWAPRDVAHGVH